jgi:hypothetical protein
MRTIVAEKGRIEFSGKIVVGGLGVSLVLVAGMVLAFATGMVETLGYESRDISGTGLTSTRMGHSFGLKTFYFIKGQEFFAEYETDIQKGSLTVHLYKIGSMPSSKTPYHRLISQSGKGTVVFPIQESGLYRMSFRGTVLGVQRNTGGYDLSYQIRWGIRELTQ